MLDLLFGPPRRRTASPYEWPRGGVLSTRVRTVAGPVVDEDLALTYAAVWCATRFLTETTAGLPLGMYRRLPGNDREPAADHYLFDLVKCMPNPWMGSMAFREGRTMHQVNWGNGFGEIEREAFNDPRSPIIGLHPIHPGRVRPVRLTDQVRDPRYKYLVRNNDGREVAFRPEELLHVPGTLSEDGVWGKGVIAHARESVGFGLGTERHGARQFGTGNMPQIVVHGPGMRDGDARKNFREEWRDIHGHPEGDDVAILPFEAKIEKLNFSNEDAQFLETRKHNVSEIARWYRLPPYILGELEGAVKANIEQQGIELIIYSIFPWPRRWEEQLALKLLTEQERQEYYFEHNFAGLLRGDIGARMAAYRTAIMIGLLTINEARRLENMNGIGAAGDVHYVPLNMTTAERMMLGTDESEPAFAGPGSDQNGAPADGGGNADNAAAFDGWARRRLKKLERQFLQTHLRDMEHRLANARPAEAAPASRTAARAVLVDALGRMFTKEANAARRIAAANVDLEAWLGEFYGKHRDTLARALEPAAAVLDSAGIACDAGGLADRFVAASQRELRESFNAESREAFLERLGRWPHQRAEESADAILAGEGP